MDVVSQSSRVSAFVLGLRIALTQTVRGHTQSRVTPRTPRRMFLKLDQIMQFERLDDWIDKYVLFTCSR